MAHHPLGGPLKPSHHKSNGTTYPAPLSDTPELGAWNQARQDAAEKVGLDLEKLSETGSKTKARYMKAFRRLVEKRGLVEPISRH